MEDLFRFIMLRPPQEADEDASVSLAAETDFQKELQVARNENDPKTAMKAAAALYIAGSNFVRDLSTLTYHEQFMFFYQEFMLGDRISLKSLNNEIAKLFELTREALLINDDFISDKHRVMDSIIAIKLVPSEQVGIVDELIIIMRVIGLFENPPFIVTTPGKERIDLKRARTRTIALPSPLFPITPSSSSAKAQRPDLDQRRADEIAKAREIVDNRASSLEAGIRELMRLTPDKFIQPELDSSTQLEVASSEAPKTSTSDNRVGSPSIQKTSSAALMLKTETVQSLSEETQALLTEFGLDTNLISMPKMVERLEMALADLAQELPHIVNEPAVKNIARIGSRFFENRSDISESSSSRFGASSIPTSRGEIQPIGVGDLLVVKQQITGYEPGEVAHIENILKGESKERQHRRSKIIEETFTTETELTSEEERSLESTGRFELQREISKTVQEENQFKVGASLSASYGPFVEFKASTEFASKNSKQEANKQASSFSKEVSERSASKVTERVRTEQTRRTVEEYEETNRHAIDNGDGRDHIVGVYQWVNKVYEGQVFNYGKRRLFDMMIPEPAAFLLHSLKSNIPEGEGLVKPDPFILTSDQINPFNYALYVHRYGATGIEPPPQAYVTVSKSFEERSENKDGGSMTNAAELQIPSGYQAISGSAYVDYTFWEDDDTSHVTVAIGRQSERWEEPIYGSRGYTLSNEVETIPVAVTTFLIATYVVAVEITCERTDNLYRSWQIKTHAAISQAYQQQLSEYEEKLAALAVEQGIEIEGRNPALNRTIERTEIKKACISLLTNQHYDLFDAIETGAFNYPQPDIDEANVEGRYIRFFEQAFEWEQMMYLFYPYYWGRKANWVERILTEDTDPLHAEFLKAGSARVVVPVRPGFESAVSHFLDTGEIWLGSDVPDLASPLYLSIVEEIKELQDASGNEVPYGEPWQLRLPTTLVRLREDGSLPQWEKDDEGNWVPVG